jgi:hypothetical protein
MTATTEATASTITTTPVVYAGNTTVHAGRQVGLYPSGEPKYAATCGGRRANHDPMPVDSDITCKRCIARTAAPGLADAGDTSPAAETHVPLDLRGVLVGAGIPRAGAATVAKVLDELAIDGTQLPAAEICARLKARIEGTEKVGLTGKSAIVWIVTGEDATAQVKKAQLERQMRESVERGHTTSRRASRNADVSEADQKAAELGTEAAAAKGKKLSQRVAGKEAATARAALLTMAADQIAGGGWPNVKKAERTPEFLVRHYVPTILGFTSEKAMREYVDGRVAAIKPEAKTGVKELTKLIGSHQVWARKAAAAAFGIALQAKTGGE